MVAELCALARSAFADFFAALRARRWPRVAAVAAVLLPVLGGGLSLLVSWQRWINPLIDSGREMDVPWRLGLGERLYRDVTYYYGPLGPWCNALALRLFGNRWAVLQAVCLLLSAAILSLLYKLLRQAGASRLAAIAGPAMAAVLCMGAPNGGAFIFPYSSSGLLALAGALLALCLAGLDPSPLHQAGAALGLAVALAARIEVGVPVAAALLLCGVRARPLRATLRSHLRVVALGGAAAAAAYGAALWGLSWREITHDGPLTHFLGMPLEWHKLYMRVSGLGTPLQSAGQLVFSMALDGAMLVLLGWFALPAHRAEPAADGAVPTKTGEAELPPERRCRSHAWYRRYLFPASMLALLSAYLLSSAADPFKNLPPFALALPLVAAAAAAVVWLRRPLASTEDRARFLLFAWSAAEASRVVFNLTVGPKISPYATLPLPGLLATAALLGFDALPAALPDPATYRRRLTALLVVIAGIYLYRIDRADHRQTTTLLQTAAGSLRLPAPEAESLQQALRFLGQRARPGDTLTAFPESGFFNFLTGLRSPLRQDVVFPGVLAGDRETEAARLIATAGPRFILLCNRPTTEWGPTSFGSDYCVRLWREVQQDYALDAAFGAPPTTPVGPGRFFIRIYERLPRPATPRLNLAAAPQRPRGAVRLAARLRQP
jgi:4-amino-4-deoxy-L-arabinose transferase-like glycosyltransferase